MEQSVEQDQQRFRWVNSEHTRKLLANARKLLKNDYARMLSLARQSSDPAVREAASHHDRSERLVALLESGK